MLENPKLEWFTSILAIIHSSKDLIQKKKLSDREKATKFLNKMLKLSTKEAKIKGKIYGK